MLYKIDQFPITNRNDIIENNESHRDDNTANISDVDKLILFNLFPTVRYFPMNQLHDDVRLTYVIELIEFAITISTTKPV